MYYRAKFRLSQEEAAERIAGPNGYVLKSAYQHRRKKVLLWCPKHNQTYEAAPQNVWRGGHILCCARAANSARMSKAMAGAGNNFHGRSHSEETKLKISQTKRTSPHSGRGKPRPAHITAAILRAITGVSRPNSVRDKVRIGVIRRHADFDYNRRKAANGKTAGRPGIFYIAKLPDGSLKFGSTLVTAHYRLVRLRQRHGAATSLLLHCHVPDAGAFEVTMMERYREHWVYAERFTNWLDV